MPKNMKLIICIALLILIGYSIFTDFGARSILFVRSRGGLMTTSKSVYYPPDKPVTSNHFSCKFSLTSSITADANRKVDSAGEYINIITGDLSDISLYNINVTMDNTKLNFVYPQKFREDSPGPEFTITKKDKQYLTAVSYENERLNTMLFTINFKTGKAILNHNLSHLRPNESPSATISYMMCEDI